MNTGIIVTIGVIVLACLFGLIILSGRKGAEGETAVSKTASGPQLSPTERWDKHVEELQKRGS